MTARLGIHRHHETGKEIAETGKVEHEGTEICRKQWYDGSYGLIL